MNIHIYLMRYYVGITKMLFSRRDMEPAQRTNAFKIADSLSGVLQSHINWKRLGRHPFFSAQSTEVHLEIFVLTKLLRYIRCK